MHLFLMRRRAQTVSFCALRHRRPVCIKFRYRSGAANYYWILALGIAVLAMLGFLAYRANHRDAGTNELASTKTEKADSLSGSHVADVPAGWVSVGGILRPKTDVVLNAGQAKDGESNLPTKVLHGFSPPVNPNANKQVEAVFTALKDRSNPNAFSSFAVAKSFDLEAYRKDPQAFLNEVEPSRVFSPAQPGEGVKAIRPAGSAYHDVRQGESVKLVVETENNAPVTFTSFDLGYFGNELTSITVQADDRGIASAQFTAGGGTIDDVKILAASPMTTGQVKFRVNVRVGD